MQESPCDSSQQYCPVPRPTPFSIVNPTAVDLETSLLEQSHKCNHITLAAAFPPQDEISNEPATESKQEELTPNQGPESNPYVSTPKKSLDAETISKFVISSGERVGEAIKITTQIGVAENKK